MRVGPMSCCQRPAPAGPRRPRLSWRAGAVALALAMLAACQPATVSNGPGVGQGQAAPPSSQQPVTATRPPDAPPPALPGTLPSGSGPASQPGQAAPQQQLPAEKRDRVALLVPLSGRAAAHLR